MLRKNAFGDCMMDGFTHDRNRWPHLGLGEVWQEVAVDVLGDLVHQDGCRLQGPWVNCS